MAKRNQAKTPAQAAAARTTDDAQSARADSRRAQRVLAQRRAARNRRLAALGGFGGVALLIVLGLIWYTTRSESVSASNAPVTLPTPYSSDIPKDAETLGDPNAKVVLQEWGDYQCPGCGQFARNTEQQLIDDYVSTGKVRFEFHDFPFLDQLSDTKESHDAAEAAHCAGDQGQFWNYHRALYYNQEAENKGGFATKRLTEIASQLGLDTQQFSSCLAAGTHADEIQQSYDQGTQLGINQTPTFFVNGQKISGANYSQIKQALDTALAGQ